MLLLSGVTWLVRLWYPIDQWVRLVGFIPAEIAHLPQYLSMFLIGVAAWRGNWLQLFPAARGYVWLMVGLAAAALRYGYMALRAFGLPALISGGGPGWDSLVWSGWEALICVGLCIGLPVLFREKLAMQGRLLPTLARSSYATYVLHIWPVVGIQVALAGIALPPFAKFALATALALPLCFGLGLLIAGRPAKAGKPQRA